MKSNTTSSRPHSGAPPEGLLKFLPSLPMSLSESRFRYPSVPMLRPRFPRRRSYKFPKDVSTNSPTRPAAMLQSSVPTIVMILVVTPGKPCRQVRRAAGSGVLPDCGIDSSSRFVEIGPTCRSENLHCGVGLRRWSVPISPDNRYNRGYGDAGENPSSVVGCPRAKSKSILSSSDTPSDGWRESAFVSSLPPLP